MKPEVMRVRILVRGGGRDCQLIARGRIMGPRRKVWEPEIATSRWEYNQGVRKLKMSKLEEGYLISMCTCTCSEF